MWRLSKYLVIINIRHTGLAFIYYICVCEVYFVYILTKYLHHNSTMCSAHLLFNARFLSLSMLTEHLKILTPKGVILD